MKTFNFLRARREFIIPVWFFIAGLSSAGFSSATFAAESPSIREICVEFHEALGKYQRPSKWRLIRDIIRLKYFPGSMVRVQHSSIDIPIDKKIREAGIPPEVDQSSESGENIIFSIDPPERFTNSEKIEALRVRNEELNKILNRLIPQLLPIISAQTIDKCVALAQQSHFDFEYFKKISEEKKSLRILDQMREAKVANAVIANTVGRLNLDWKVIHTTDLLTVHQALKNPRTRNVVLLSHGISSGKLVDSSLNEYPLGFFSDISPSIRSISIFSCHAIEIAKAYRLQEKLAKSKSHHSLRHLYVADGVKLAAMPGMEELVPVRSFRAFMRRVDSSLSRRDPITGFGGSTEDTPICKTKFPGLKVMQGTLGISLNGRFVGSVDETTFPSPEFSYPCDFEDRRKNILIIHSINLITASAVLGLDFHPVMEHSGFSLGRESMKNYLRSDGSYQGSKYEFEWNPGSFFTSFTTQ